METATARFPALEKLLARSDRTASGRRMIEIIRSLYAGDELAPGPVSRLGEGLPADSRFWFRADLVHLEAGLDRVELTAPSELRMTIDESRSLFDHVFRSGVLDDFQFQFGSEGGWYLGADREVFGSSFPDLPLVHGGETAHWLPGASGSGSWAPRLTEVQMVLHDADANARRSDEGRPTANSLWLWGGGRLPRGRVTGPRHLWSRNPFAMGVAVQMGGKASTTGTSWADVRGTIPNDHSVLDLEDISCSASKDIRPTWCDLTRTLEQDWIAPMLEWLTSGDGVEVCLYPGNGSCHRVDQIALRRFWRRSRPLRDWRN